MSIVLNVENFMQRHEQVTPFGGTFNLVGFDMPTLFDLAHKYTCANIMFNAFWCFLHFFYWIFCFIRYICTKCCVECVLCAPIAACIEACCCKEPDQNLSAVSHAAP